MVNKSFRRFLDKKPGERFLFLHKLLRNQLGRKLIVYIVLFILSFIFFIIGIALLFLPGPGIFFILLSLVPLVYSSRRIAKLMDQLEISIRKKLPNSKK